MRDEVIRVAVIGVGQFGRIHASKYAASARAQLVAVADTDVERGQSVAQRYGVRPVADYRELAGQVDAVSIAVPTSAHYEVARFFLENGVHVLIEKPITSEISQADELISLARSGKLALQVGHLVRFFAQDTGLLQSVSQPHYIEVDRISPYVPRVADVSIVLDLMIHDIDLILALVDSPVVQVDAVGSPVLSEVEDIVNARLQFENGCVANITASRVAFKSERRMRIFQPDCVYMVDSLKGSVTEVRKPDGMKETSGTDLYSSGFEIVEHGLSEHDALQAEIDAFLASIASDTDAVVTGEDGRTALEVAHRILDSVKAQSALVRLHRDHNSGKSE